MTEPSDESNSVRTGDKKSNPSEVGDRKAEK